MLLLSFESYTGCELRADSIQIFEVARGEARHHEDDDVKQRGARYRRRRYHYLSIHSPKWSTAMRWYLSE